MILLDTQVLLWLVTDSPRLGNRAYRSIQASWADHEVYASAYTFWEIAMLHAKGRLNLDRLPRSLHRSLLDDGLQLVPLDSETAISAAELSAAGLGKDPADGIILATAAAGGYRLATADREMTQWAEQTRTVSILDPSR